MCPWSRPSKAPKQPEESDECDQHRTFMVLGVHKLPSFPLDSLLFTFLCGCQPLTVSATKTASTTAFELTDAMKSIFALLPLFSAAMAEYISSTCRDLALDPTTEVLSGECNDGQGDNAAWQPASLDLNTCLDYDEAQATILVRNKDPWGRRYWGHPLTRKQVASRR